jgi:hypothetical protein
MVMQNHEHEEKAKEFEAKFLAAEAFLKNSKPIVENADFNCQTVQEICIQPRDP